MAVSVRAEALVHTETATVTKERAAKPESTRTGEAVLYEVQPSTDCRRQSGGGKEGRTNAVCLWNKNEKTVPHGLYPCCTNHGRKLHSKVIGKI